ncbi:MAG TPA: histidinol-phosphate transaminase [Bacteroidales bacterium]|mgnify:FL=1|nr:histidinol-phosphate transaminase [Bacteroidales bacterium]HQK71640.1 histidinol-phosphate transaminase [Bacteroidales bacterium]
MVNIGIKKQLIFLDRNENNYGPAPACKKVLRRRSNGFLNIYSRDFTRGVKSVLSERLSQDTGIPESRILLGYGSEDILKQVVQCYLKDGGKILIPSYSWWYYKKIAAEASGVNIEYPIIEIEKENRFEYDIDILLKTYREKKPAIILLSSPNNPTGNRLEIKQLKLILDNTPDCTVILDEAYSKFDPGFNVNAAEFVEKYPQLIIIRTFSKYYALAGLRIGYALIGARHEHLQLLSTRYLGFNRLPEQIAIAALNSSDYYRKIQRKMVQDREMLYNEFNALPGFKAYVSYANFILVRIPAEIKESLQKYLTDRDIIIKFMNEDNLNSHVRITIGTTSQNRKLINAVRNFMNERSRS